MEKEPIKYEKVSHGRVYVTKVPDLSGKIFGEWAVLSNFIKLESGKDTFVKWECLCNCGTRRYVRSKTLLLGLSKSCGHPYSKVIQSGTKRGRWTVLSFLGKVKKVKGDNNNYWMCKCECGTERPVANSSLFNYKSKSCGCLTDHSYHRLKYGDAAFHLLEKNYRKRAKKGPCLGMISSCYFQKIAFTVTKNLPR